MTNLSVVIATRDRPQLLADCLTVLGRQTVAPAEIVVVDDGSRCDLDPVVGLADTGRTAVSLVRIAPSGLSAARNAGVDAAAGDAVAFLDDDALAAPGWVEAIMREFDETACDAVAGRIDLLLPGPAPRWLSPGVRSFLGELDLGHERRWLEDGSLPNGGNSAVTKEAHARAGAFPTSLGRRGTSLMGNEEVAYFRKLREAGGRIRYAPEAQVRHRIEPERLSAEFLRKRAFAQGQSDVAVELKNGTRRHPTTEAMRLVRTVPILMRGVTRDASAIGARLWLDYCAGRRRGRRASEPIR